MEDNNDILGLVFKALEDNDMWFTTKNDPTFEEPSSYYELDEFGDLTEKSQKKIAREVESYIGDGAIDNVDAVNIWLTDAQSSYKVDFKDNLVTKFSPKPVVAGIEAYENSVPLAEAKVKKTEGAGAGYTISGTFKNVKVNSYEVVDEYVDNSDYGGQEKCFVLKCDIDVDIEDMKFSSYEYGGELEFPVKAKITDLVLFDYDYDENSLENAELDEAGIISALEDITFEDVLGAGWVHQAFTGTFETSIDGSSYSVLTADNCTISIDNETVIDYIDNKVTGNIDLYTYAVLDEEGEELKDDFSDEKEAIKYAQEHNGVTVDRIYHNWKLIGADGSLDDEPDHEVIWERDYDKHYKYDVEENKQLKETESPFRYKVYGVRKNGELVDGFGGSSLYKNFQEAVIDAKELGADEIVEYGFANEKAYNDKELAEDEKVIWKKKTENFKLGTKDKTLSENYQRRLDEVNNKSKNLISSMFTDNSFDSDSKQGQIIMRTSEMFNALSDKGYDVEVTFDNGESTSAIQLGQQGGKVMITITNTDQPLRAFTAGNIEVTDESIKILQDIQTQIEVL